MGTSPTHLQWGSGLPGSGDGKRGATGRKSLKDQQHAIAAHKPNPCPKPRTFQSWKPMTLRAPALGSFIAATALLIAILEVLSNRSRQNGGVILAGSMDDISAGQLFMYQYLPTIIAVLYSMLWSWIDLDAKRLEPYFQLSKPEGALAESSLLLEYPVDFLAFVPIRALKRRHWTVFCAGTAMMIIFWAITPMQSAIFATSTRAVVHSTSVDSIAPLLQPDQQHHRLDVGFMNDAYSILWLGKKLPPFTTREFALQPFTLRQVDHFNMNDVNWTAPTVSYSTELSCAPAIVTISENSSSSNTFSNGKDCTVPNIGLMPVERYIIQYLGFYDSAYTDYAMENPDCPLNPSHNHLAIWADSQSKTKSGTFLNLTAMFCEASYYSQDVIATVNLPDFDVSTVSPTSPKRKLGDEIFNLTSFEYVIGAGVSSLTIPRDMPDTVLLEQWPRLADKRISWPMTNMVGFALANPNITTEQYSQPALLQEGFQKAHQLLFTMAVRQVIGPTTKPQAELVGEQSTSVYSIFVIRAFAIAVEACLGLVAILALVLLCLTCQRTSSLSEDPASISHIFSLLSYSGDSVETLRNYDIATSAVLKTHLRGARYRISRAEKNSSQISKLETRSLPSRGRLTEDKQRQFENLDCSYSPINPFELGPMVALPLIFVLLAFMTAITVLYIFSLQRNGLPQPSQSTIGQQILLNYLPTAFATFLEPVWVVLNRLLCILHPFEILRHGNARKSTSLDLKYTSLPPQLVVWRAIKAKHMVLASVCAVAILANPLAVALSGLFQDIIVDVEQSTIFNYLHVPSIDRDKIHGLTWSSKVPTAYEDHFYVAKTNISDGTPLPPWTTPEFFFLPFDLKTTPKPTSNVTYRTSTRAFGVDPICRRIRASEPGSQDHIRASPDGGYFNVSTSLHNENGRIVECTMDNIFKANTSEGRFANEHFMTMNAGPNASTADGELCTGLVLAGWARANTSASHTSNSANSSTNSSHNTSYKSMLMICEMRLRSAEFTITVDTSGQVLSTVRSEDFNMDANRYLRGNGSFPYSTPSFLITLQGGLQNSKWHNDTFASDWINYLFKKITNSSAILDPNEPVPEFTPTAAVMEDLLRRLFAIILGLNPHVFLPAAPTDRVPGIVISQAHRIFLSRNMFIITIVLLSINVVVALLYYVRRPRAFLPRMPTSLASLMAYLAASRALAESRASKRCMGSDSSQMDSEAKAASTRTSSEPRFGFGKYIGVDGQPHVGIERYPLVVPLDLNALRSVRKRKATREADQDRPRHGDTAETHEWGTRHQSHTAADWI